MAKAIPARSEVPAEHKWNLSSLFKDDAAWEEGLAALGAMLQDAEACKKAGIGHSAEAFLPLCLLMSNISFLKNGLGIIPI